MVGALALTNSTLQFISPPEYRGRIMSMYTLAVIGLSPLGSLQAGAVAEALGVRTALTLGGAVCLAYFLILLVVSPYLQGSLLPPAPPPTSGNKEPQEKDRS
jgi:MFS family permease